MVHVGGGRARVAVMDGNGHCLFAALVHQLKGTPPSSPDFIQQVFSLRRRVVHHIRAQLQGDECESWQALLQTTVESMPDRYPESIPLEDRIRQHLEALHSTAEWGAGETLRAVSEMESVGIRVHYEAGGPALVFGTEGQRELAVVYRLRALQEEDGGCVWNHYDSCVRFK